MFYMFRKIEDGEFICVGGDTAGGGMGEGTDENFHHYYSKTRNDIPMVYHAPGVAASHTDRLHQALERIADITGIRPVVALERNNGGANEMFRLSEWNRDHKYQIFLMPKLGKEVERDSDLPGWDTNQMSRGVLLNDLGIWINSRRPRIYDEVTITQLKVFITNKHGKAEAAPGEHDDAVIALGVTQQIAIRSVPMTLREAAAEAPDWAQQAPSWSGIKSR